MSAVICREILKGLDKIEELRDALQDPWIDKQETMRLLNATRVKVARLENLKLGMDAKVIERRYGHDCNEVLKGIMNCQQRFLTARGLK